MGLFSQLKTLLVRSVALLLVAAWIVNASPSLCLTILSLTGQQNAPNDQPVTVQWNIATVTTHAHACKCRQCGLAVGKHCCCEGRQNSGGRMAFRAVCDTEEMARTAPILPPAIGNASIALVRPPVSAIPAPLMTPIADLSGRTVSPTILPPRSLS